MTLPHHVIDFTQLRECRRKLLETWPSTLRLFDLHTSDSFRELENLGIDLFENQLFMPEPLWHVAPVKDDVLTDGRPDCLGRSVLGMVTDAGFRSLWVGGKIDTDSIKVDILGRDQWYLACCTNDYQRLRQLQEAAVRTQGTVSGNYVSTPFAFHLAAARGEIGIFQMLRRAPTAIWDTVMCSVDENDQTCLAAATASGHLNIVDLICQACSLETLAKIWSHKVPLHIAVYNKSAVIVSSFIELFRNLDPAALDFACPERDLPSPFWYATRSDDIIMMELLEPYADINRECRGLTPLLLAIQDDSTSVVEYLLNVNSREPTKRRIDINAHHGKDGLTALEVAVMEGKPKCADLLRAHGAHNRAQSQWGLANTDHLSAMTNNDLSIIDVDEDGIHVHGDPMSRRFDPSMVLSPLEVVGQQHP
jgi:ankyrin repeat protein